jgi:hypothetical protein
MFDEPQSKDLGVYSQVRTLMEKLLQRKAAYPPVPDRTESAAGTHGESGWVLQQRSDQTASENQFFLLAPLRMTEFSGTPTRV